MKKLAFMLALFMVVGAIPGWCLEATVDSFVDTHTKSSTFRPVQDAGEIYGTVNHQIGSTMDQIPVIKERSVIMNPIDKLLKDSVEGVRSIINGTWDLLTFKSMRDKPEVKK